MSYGQGGPVWTPGGPPQTPDWSALAADAERRRHRRRWWGIGGGVLAAAVIGTVVALAIVNQSDDDGGSTTTLPDPKDLPPDTSRPEPTFEETTLPPLPEPEDFISDPDKDIAPFSADDFFAGDVMEIEGRTYQEVITRGSRDCASGVTQDLGAVLTDNDCAELLRATYTGDGVAVTVGVAQFPTEEAARAARNDAVANLLPLTAGDAPDFCQLGGCRTTTNQVGRYAYFTIAGNSDGSPDEGDGTPAQQASLDGNDHAFECIIQRGEAQASASASALVEERENGDG
ncbi:hypothetical protein [Streptomyces sp. B6B3]|uniref:hypothetical protein n=1 Tax=Streptomyces sp. B6B3 TaxID=3153570 RepID=UPI00325DCE83